MVQLHSLFSSPQLHTCRKKEIQSYYKTELRGKKKRSITFKPITSQFSNICVHGIRDFQTHKRISVASPAYIFLRKKRSHGGLDHWQVHCVNMPLYGPLQQGLKTCRLENKNKMPTTTLNLKIHRLMQLPTRHLTTDSFSPILPSEQKRC